MISKTKLAAIAIAATIGMASPAFAEFLETGTAANDAEGGLGNGRYAWTVPQNGQILYDRSGRSAYAMVPHAQAGAIDNPALNGGGSNGYNESLRHDW